MAKFIRVRKYVRVRKYEGCRDGDRFSTMWLNVDKIICFYQGPFIKDHQLTTIEYGENRIAVAETITELLTLIEQAR